MLTSYHSVFFFFLRFKSLWFVTKQPLEQVENVQPDQSTLSASDSCVWRGPAAANVHSSDTLRLPPLTYTHLQSGQNNQSFFFYCHCAWTLTLQVTQGVSCSELMNTLTCQWCALVTLSAGFVSVDGFSNKLLADPAPMLKTKGMQDETLVSKNGQHPGGQHLFFFLLLHTSSLPMPSICGTLGKP